MVELDDVDRGILHELQVEARKKTAQEIADTVGVSASTVRNRIDHLEDEGVIEGYHPKISYEKANFPLQILFVCTADPTERSEMVEKVLGIQGVIDVREMLTGRRNIYVEVIGTSTVDITRITDAIHALDLSIESSEIMSQRRVQPFNHFHLNPDHASEAEQSDE
ncbi:Lrp/AsnC family transcriptional regulator [Halegenticoccus soli]|uniref:Lrp/AsnC family transcriptional regulator n=1 Tax=Halegenticoccus soli TaxID=1985678 RepID=UPI000C6DE6CE|nr:winged helix-turn-helix transcriptional regulator [Halegenticoccus soli]